MKLALLVPSWREEEDAPCVAVVLLVCLGVEAADETDLALHVEGEVIGLQVLPERSEWQTPVRNTGRRSSSVMPNTWGEEKVKGESHGLTTAVMSGHPT